MMTELENGEAGAPLILVVEDYPDAREMYAEYLRFSGFRVTEARNGEEALHKALENVPDVVLMDLALPLMDGWEATRRLKGDPRSARTLVVALTGHALAGHAEGARRAGCDAFVTKPCLPDELVDVIHKLLDARDGVVAPPRETGPAQSKTDVSSAIQAASPATSTPPTGVVGDQSPGNPGLRLTRGV